MNNPTQHRPLRLTIIDEWHRLGHLGNAYVRSYLNITPKLFNNVIKEYNESGGFITVESKINNQI